MFPTYNLQLKEILKFSSLLQLPAMVLLHLPYLSPLPPPWGSHLLRKCFLDEQCGRFLSQGLTFFPKKWIFLKVSLNYILLIFC